ncbi:MAG: CYTH domain-containing protein [Chromatiales bacterium]|jgi:adenylate cyclase
MAVEIERKFLVTNNSWKQQADKSFRLRQGYLGKGPERSVRVRTSEDGRAFLNIKSSTNGIRRLEFDYEIPIGDAIEILEQIAIKPVIDKTRYLLNHAGHLWEIDEFHGANAGLIVAEVELQHEDEDYKKPDWLGQEVSDDARYYNMNLIDKPYSEW